MNEHEKINYVEFQVSKLAQTKQFFETVFNWEFTDYGPEYSAFSDQGIHGGFYQSELCSTTDTGGALVVFFSNDLEATLANVEAAGGKVIKPIFSFPGGRRFQFLEPSGNEFAVWAE